MKTKIFKIITRVITTILSIITFLLMLLAAYNFFSVKILKNDYPNIFGYTFFEVISGSMSPSIEKWDLILVKLDTDYEVGDIVSFKSGEAYITHRIVEKKGDTYITKGDANNTFDTPITKDVIAGKVVNVYPTVAAWIKVATTPKVMIGSIISIVLVCYTITLFKKEEKEKIEKIEKDNKIGKSELMEQIKNNTKLKVEICILFILLISLLFLVPYTLSRFKTEARSDAVMDIAFFVANDEYTHEEITLDDMTPGDSKSYTFSVSNFIDNNRTDVNIDYYVEIATTTNLPLDYELYSIDGDNQTNAIISDEIISDDDGTYFRIIKTSNKYFNFNDNLTDYYKLTVNFENEYKNFKYQGVSENIEIRINAKQIIDSDN